MSLSQEEYDKAFKDKKEKALEYALDIRKFEIELYWKRATYFWLFIAATFTGYMTIQSSIMVNKVDFLVILSCLGIVFSFAWFLANKGSKKWQENWEHHVDLLEYDVIGPLYKIHLKKEHNNNDKILCRIVNYITTDEFSVSKINQIINIYIIIFWIFLLFYSMPEFKFSSSFNVLYISIVIVTLFLCFLLFYCGNTKEKGQKKENTLTATKRETYIEAKKKE